jgi:hypothetical protein
MAHWGKFKKIGHSGVERAHCLRTMEWGCHAGKDQVANHLNMQNRSIDSLFI